MSYQYKWFQENNLNLIGHQRESASVTKVIEAIRVTKKIYSCKLEELVTKKTSMMIPLLLIRTMVMKMTVFVVVTILLRIMLVSTWMMRSLLKIETMMI